jgi:DNA helicase-2/ATP-dependent DNA helicase PcrA
VEAVTGPVCILAGAGTGKTTTITRRIANQVLTGAFKPSQILAVTLTKKAAEEMKRRLAELGAGRVQTRTFHSAAARQLSYFAGEHKPIIASKFEILGPIVRNLPKPYDRRALSDIATKIEWAKNRRLNPERYVSATQKTGRKSPIPAEMMEGVYQEYERTKQASGRIDYEDQLELTIRLFQDDPAKLAVFREGYRAFTVDEYQDVNLLQQTLLDIWLGERDDLCVVGDDYQSIYGFTGATPGHLLDMPERYPNPTVVVLESNYRSTPEIIELANRLVPGLGGRKKVLRPTISSGPKPATRSFESGEIEADFIAKRIHGLHQDGVALREMAILYRLNYRSSLYEAALIQVGIPFQVRGGGFLERKAAKQVVPRLERRGFETAVVQAVGEEARNAGYLIDAPPDIGAAELAFQEDLAQLVALAGAFDDGARTLGEFVSYLRDRFESESQRDAVQLMTYHSAKGLEFEAVFLPWLEEGEIPDWRAAKAGAVQEERRLFYVGLTRAKRYLFMTRSSGKKPPSRFLAELHPPRTGAGSRPGQQDSRRPRRSRSNGIVAHVGRSLEWGSYQGVIESMDEAGVWLRVGAANIHVRFGRGVSAGKRSGPLKRPG